MDGTFNLTPIMRQIESHRDREINEILDRARGQFSSPVLKKVFDEFLGEISQKAGDFVTAEIEIAEIKAGLDSTVQRAFLFLSAEFAKRGLKDSTAYLNAKAHWQGQFEVASEALVERCKITLSKKARKSSIRESVSGLRQGNEMQSRQKSGLHPWGVVSAIVFDLGSDEIVEIMSLSGLQVDWDLTGNEGFSHTTRRRAYRPRVDAAFTELNESERLRVAWIVSSEFVRRRPDRVDELRERLSAIGWAFDDGNIRPASGEVAELFFPGGSQHDAYKRIRAIIATAQRKVTIVDPYLDGSILTILGAVKKPLQIELLSHKLPTDFMHEVQTFRKQHNPQSLEIRCSHEFHDRFIVMDDEKCFHIGASIKDAGNRAFMLSQVQDTENIRALLKQIRQSWDRATDC